MVDSSQATIDQGAASPLIPEALLALAKDARYLGECEQLLTQILPSGIDATSIAAWLYALAVVVRKGRTLGMEATGLEYAASRRYIVLTWLASCLAVTVLRRRPPHHAPCDDAERLRGDERRRRFLEQRQAMLDRASLKPTRTSTANLLAATGTTRWRRILEESLRNTLSQAVSWNGGPHSLDHGQVLTMGAWLMRLHLAFYCLSGKYPSWVQRFFRLKFESERPTRLVHRPSGARVVGLLILAQAIGTAVPALGRLVLDRIRRQQRPRSPSVRFLRSDQVADVDMETLCGICRQPRQHPACPPCGHVFCWRCLQQAAGACPLCRTPYRPSQIRALQPFEASAVQE